jgi:hypothetical protein
MAITLVGQNSQSSVNGADVDITLPTGTAADDIVLIVGGHGNDGGAAASISTSGYTTLDTASLANAYSGIVAYKRMGVSPDTDVVATGGGDASNGVAYAVIVLRGVDTGTAIDITTTEATGTTSGPNSPALTTVTNGAAIISCFVHASNSDFFTPPSGYGNEEVYIQGEVNPISVGLALSYLSPAGTENPGPWVSEDSGSWAAWTVAFRPAVPGIVSDSVLAGTGTGTASLVGSVGSSAFFTMTGGSNTAIWVGQALDDAGALSAAGTGTASFQGEGGGLGYFTMEQTATVSWVGVKEYMSSVREVIESRGAATVNVA